MKTAEKILLTSLELFNDQGEAAVNSVDIAIELDISPGNLYYHFKGKEVIISALYSMYQDQMSDLLDKVKVENSTPTDFIYFLILIMKVNHMFRFLYRNALDLTQKYPIVKKGLLKMTEKTERVLLKFFTEFKRKEWLIEDESFEKNGIDLINFITFQSPAFYMSKGFDIGNEDYIQQNIEWILTILSPHLNVDNNALNELRCELNN